VLHFPLVLCRSDHCRGTTNQIDRLLRTVDREPQIAEYVVTHDLMLTLVAAGYGVGLASANQVDLCRHPDIVTRPLAESAMMLTTYLLRPDSQPSAQLQHFIDRVHLSAAAMVQSEQ
jgi:DNA-binding transcriptional LysR family regulator